MILATKFSVCRIWQLTFAFVVGACINTSHAQQTDVRVAFLAHGNPLPRDIRIQDAHRIGNITLAVWGTTVAGPDGNPANSLVMQLLSDTNMFGPQRRLTGVSARPFDSVMIVSASNKFIVIWNDRRDGDIGLYGQLVDTGGSLIGSEVRLGGGKFTKIHTFNWPRALVLVQRDSGSIVALDIQDTIRLRSIARDRLGLDYYLSCDTALVVLKDKTIEFYSNLFDQAPIRTVPYKLPTNTWSIPLRIVRDSNGTYQLVITLLVKTTIKATLATIDTDSLRNGLVFDSLYVRYASELKYRSSNIVRDTNNTLSFSVDFDLFDGSIGKHGSWIAWWHSFSVPGIAYDSHCYTSNDSNFFSTLGTRVGCSRNFVDSLSRIIVGLSSPVHLNSQTVADILRTQRTDPNISVCKYGLLVTYRQMDTMAAFVSGYWSPELQVPTLAVASVAVTTSYSYHNNEFLQAFVSLHKQNRSSYGTIMYADSWFENYGTANVFEVHTEYGSIAYPTATSWNFLPGAYKRYEHFNFGTHTYDPNKGERIVQVVGSDRGDPPDCVTYGIGSADTIVWSTRGSVAFESIVPSIGSTFLALKPSSIYDVFVFANGVERPAFSFAPDTLYSEFLRPVLVRTYGNTFLRYYKRDSVTIRIQRFDMLGKQLDSQQLKFTYPISDIYCALNPADSSITILCASSHGVRMSLLTHQLFIRRDTIAQRLMHDVQVSTTSNVVASPAAAFRNDSMFVVWQDYRSGISDIYGTAFPLPSGLNEPTIKPQPKDTVDPAQPGAAIQVISVTPTPTRNDVIINIESAVDGIASVAMIDASGVRAKAMDVVLKTGANAIAVLTGDLFSGTYTIELRYGASVARSRVIIVR